MHGTRAPAEVADALETLAASPRVVRVNGATIQALATITDLGRQLAVDYDAEGREADLELGEVLEDDAPVAWPPADGRPHANDYEAHAARRRTIAEREARREAAWEQLNLAAQVIKASLVKIAGDKCPAILKPALRVPQLQRLGARGHRTQRHRAASSAGGDADDGEGGDPPPLRNLLAGAYLLSRHAPCSPTIRCLIHDALRLAEGGAV